MKKLYYYCRSKQNFVEIKNYKAKILIYFTFFLISGTALILGGYQFISSFSDSIQNLSTLKDENEILNSKLLETKDLYDELNKELEKLKEDNNTLRLAVNLPPISGEERLLGVGGGHFDNNIDFIRDKNLKDALSFVDEVTRKVKFEKNEFEEISLKLKENKKLYAAIPAIKPCTGVIAAHGFGMREHPILNVNKMHEGIDIITDMRTKVFTAGDGVVEFVGIAHGYGLTVEINHGFGYRTLYAHLSKTIVKEGDKVTRGSLIALTGNSGLSSGPHLHYEVSHNGIKQDPAGFFFDDLNFFELKQKKKKLAGL